MFDKGDGEDFDGHIFEEVHGQVDSLELTDHF